MFTSCFGHFTWYLGTYNIETIRDYSEILLGAIHKLRLQEEGGLWSKKLTFCKLLYHRKCKRRGVGGKKNTNFVNVVCERPLITNHKTMLYVCIVV